MKIEANKALFDGWNFVTILMKTVIFKNFQISSHSECVLFWWLFGQKKLEIQGFWLVVNLENESKKTACRWLEFCQYIDESIDSKTRFLIHLFVLFETERENLLHFLLKKNWIEDFSLGFRLEETMVFVAILRIQTRFLDSKTRFLIYLLSLFEIERKNFFHFLLKKKQN